jgi:hypothetical protein
MNLLCNHEIGYIEKLNITSVQVSNICYLFELKPDFEIVGPHRINLENETLLHEESKISDAASFYTWTFS